METGPAPIQTITNASIQGPWDMALVDGGDSAMAFVSNALTGDIIRMDFKVSTTGLTLLSAKTNYMSSDLHSRMLLHIDSTARLRLACQV
jgi:hypothetical protein